MTTTDNPPANGGAACSNRVRAFEAYGIDDGTNLVHRVWYRHLDHGIEFEPTGTFFDRLEAAFRSAFVREGEPADVPAPVSFAIEDAITEATREFGSADADLRYEVLPTVYRMIADRLCRYDRFSIDTELGVEDDDDGGGVPVTVDGR